VIEEEEVVGMMGAEETIEEMIAIDQEVTPEAGTVVGVAMEEVVEIAIAVEVAIITAVAATAMAGEGEEVAEVAVLTEEGEEEEGVSVLSEFIKKRNLEAAYFSFRWR
jgi:hypothetical protein